MYFLLHIDLPSPFLTRIFFRVPTIYGVNIGGWMVLERFINPGILFYHNDTEVYDMWTYLQKYRDDQFMMDLLETHLDTWISEMDVQMMSQIGFTHVRLPVAYWTFLSQEELDAHGEPYITGQWPYVVRFMKWLKKYNIKVFMDLHAAPGSQNGWDNR